MNNKTGRLGNLTPEQRQALEQRLLQVRTARAESAIPPVDPDKPQPLSYSQERLWFLQQLEPGLLAYNETTLLVLRGHLDLAALQTSLDSLLQRHNVLRTIYIELDGEPRQLVQPFQPLVLPLVDLSALPGASRPEQVERQMQALAAQPFDLARDLPLRARLWRLAPDEHWLLLVRHHIASDGLSSQNLENELVEAYAAAHEGRAARLPVLPMQYADFAAWQRSAQNQEKLAADLVYWREKLAGASQPVLPMLELPLDHPRPAAMAYRGAEVWFELPADLAQALGRLANQEGATLFMALLAGWAALLSRYSGQRDFGIGVPFAGRTRPEFTPLIGFFINTLVVRLNLGAGPDGQAPGGRDLLRQARQMLLEALEHHHLPFEQLVAALQPERQLNRPALVQSVCQMQPRSLSPSWDLAGLRVEKRNLARTTTQLDLQIAFYQDPGGVKAVLRYDSLLFEASRMQGLCEHLLNLLRGMVADPERPFTHLTLLGPQELRQLLVQANASEMEFSRAPVHALFEAQVRRSPQAPAVQDDSELLSYTQLNQRANLLARRLLAAGVTTGSRVGLCLERSTWMVIAQLACLKAGAAYVPLDPGYPPTRLAYMVEDAGLDILLLDASAPAALLESFHGVRLRLPDPGLLQDPMQTAAGEDLQLPVPPDAPAYMIYTSGSTGLPKGSLISHANLSNHMQWMQAAYPFHASDVVLQKTPFSFDGSVWEFYAPLLIGARLVMARPGGHLDMPYLAQSIRELGVTTLQMVPSMLNLLLETPEIAACSPANGGKLRRVFAGGEALNSALVNRFHATLQADLINLYGPTETTINALTTLCPPMPAGESAPIGRPVANCQTFILDEHLQPVPPGVVGELYVGGAGVGLGYHNRPQLNAERFIPNPFLEQFPELVKGSRLYRTGDLVRLRADGQVVFLGRVDFQVKLHGYRIELGEIEATLEQHPAVQQAVTLVAGETPESEFLAACILFHQPMEALSAAAELRRYASQRLPQAMVPSQFLFPETFPLSPAGKADRQALKQLVLERLARVEQMPQSQAVPAALSDDAQYLADLWGELIGRSPVDLQADFFALGGHSLLAIRLAARVRQAFGVSLPVRVIFENPTLGAMARLIDDLRQRQHPGVRDIGEL